MKVILFILLTLICNYTNAQFGVPINIIPFPHSTAAIAGHPNLAYFKFFGNRYLCAYYYRGRNDEDKFRFYKSYFTFKNNIINVKTKFSNKLFPYRHWYFVSSDSLIECNRFGKIFKSSTQSITYNEITTSDSINYLWEYLIIKNDTVNVRSYRTIYNKDRKLIKWEMAFDYLATNDSTWKLAETSSSMGGVQRTTYQHINDNETKITVERITSRSNTIDIKHIYYTYDDLKRLISVKEKNITTGKTYIYLYTYSDKICIRSEIRESDLLLELTEVKAYK